ncbi:MAG: MerR family transcriptional regulator [Acidimicrobiales bacterium]
MLRSQDYFQKNLAELPEAGPPKCPKDLRTGEVAARAGVNVETLRYYERRGLLAEPPRSRSGYRCYPEVAVERVRQVKVLQELGFSLADISSLLALRTDSPITCNDLSRLARDKLAIVEEKLAALRGVHDALIDVTRSCCDSAHDHSACGRLQQLDPVTRLDSNANHPHTSAASQASLDTEVLASNELK